MDGKAMKDTRAKIIQRSRECPIRVTKVCEILDIFWTLVLCPEPIDHHSQF